MVELRDYTKIIQSVTVLDKLNLTLESGKIYGVKGKNGSGKTMLLRALAGLIYPTAGSLLIDGTPLEKGHFPRALACSSKPLRLCRREPGYRTSWRSPRSRA